MFIKIKSSYLHSYTRLVVLSLKSNMPPTNTGQSQIKHRNIIVKFKFYDAKSRFMKGRKTLRENKSSVFINEQLTPYRSKLAFECRKLKKDKRSNIVDTWSYDGNIFVKTSTKGNAIRIYELDDLRQFGFTG